MFFTLLALLPFTLAAPVDLKLAPIKRATVEARAVASNAFIVAIKPNTVDPNNRGAWFDRVMTESGVTASARESDALKLGWDESVFNGISGTFSEDEIRALRAQDEVAYLEPDYVMSISETVQQTDTTWGISRMSLGTVSLAGFDPTLLQFPYFSDDSAGEGTDIYVLDTGIRETHLEFEGRATFLASFGPGVKGQDLNGHGTHVAGTAAGLTVGMAKKASVFAIKVFGDDGSGATSDILSGISLAVQRSLQNPDRPSVVNMSLGGPISRALDAAVSNAIGQGVPFCIAAGNEAQDAGNVSPARVPEAITVGATDINDQIASFSNFGDSVDVFAPGDTIISASFQTDDGGAILSGTSMSTPHIAGLAALLMGQEGKLTPAALQARIKELSIANIIRGVPVGTVNALAFNGAVDPDTLQDSLNGGQDDKNQAPAQAPAQADAQLPPAPAGGLAGARV